MTAELAPVPAEFPVDPEWEAKHLQAEQLRDWADRLTMSRIIGAVPLAAAIIASGDAQPKTRLRLEVGSAVGEAVSAATDFFDGWLAKRARNIDGQECRVASAKRDADADKVSEYASMVGLIGRELLRGDKKRAAFLGANLAVVATRDYLYNRERTYSSGDKPKMNRFKTAAQMVTKIVAASPVDRHPVGRQVVNAGVIAGSGMSVLSYLQFKKRQATASSAYNSGAHVEVVPTSDAASATPVEHPDLVLLTSS